MLPFRRSEGRREPGDKEASRLHYTLSLQNLDRASNRALIMNEAQFVIPLESAAAADVERVGQKAANLAALTRAGPPTPGGFCLTADAYRREIAEIGLTDVVARFGAADPVERRRLSVAIRLGLYE